MDEAIKYSVKFTRLSREMEDNGGLQQNVALAKTHVKEAFRETGMITDDVIVREEDVDYVGANRVIRINLYVTPEAVIDLESFDPDLLADVAHDYLDSFDADNEYYDTVDVVQRGDYDRLNFSRSA